MMVTQAAADCSRASQLAAAAAAVHPTGPATPNQQQPAQAAPADAECLLCSSAAAAFDTSQQQQQQYLQLLAGMTLQLAELEGPKRGLALTADEPLLRFYKQGLQAAVQEKGPNARVFVLSNGAGGVLALLAAAAGAASVVVIEKGRWGFRAAQQLLDGNKQQQPDLVGKVQLVPVPLTRCFYNKVGNNNTTSSTEDTEAPATAEGQAQEGAECDAVVHVIGLEQQQQQPGQGSCAGSHTLSGEAAGAGCFYLDHQADIVVTDLLDYR
jgi:hypothetical protein